MPSTRRLDEPQAPRAGAPSVVLLGGPNGAGKTTTWAAVRDVFRLKVFVNADVIARGLAGDDPDRAALQAGRQMLMQLRTLAIERASFAFESTLSSRSFVPWLKELIASGYEFHLVYVWLRSAELAVQRVHSRAAHGGHFVPDETVRRRYARSCTNALKLYLPLARSWRVYDNSRAKPRLVGFQSETGTRVIVLAEEWKELNEAAESQDDRPDDLG